ncbi:exonuclease mut-7 homolog isoform X2 [Latimeria chalumnae]|uniref:exonuclease mut-7 homolog isoform X2 n=1 Tax=Latimeria chalumnae TaxID=7897 RepID=UPI00313EFC84
MSQDSGLTESTEGLHPAHLLNTLQTLWTKKEFQALQQEARRGFAALKDPLEGLLDILEYCNDLKKGKGHSLGHYIINEFQDWIKEHPFVQQCNLKLRKLQAQVFNIIAESQTNLLDPLISIYQLDKADKDYLLGHVKYLYHKGKYKEAIVLSIKLHLQPDLCVEEMCTPMLLQEKTNLAEAFVADYPELQSKLVQMLDRWCDPTFNSEDLIRQYRGMFYLKKDKLNHKVLSKLVFRLMELYGIDPVLCPNVVNQRHLATVKYLLYKRFVEKSMTAENWSDHIQSTVGDNQWLQEQLVSLLIRYSDYNTAAQWALHYHLPPERLPFGIETRMQELQLEERAETRKKVNNKENWETPKRKNSCYQLPVPEENIHFLDTLEGLKEWKSSILQPCHIVGIDMEWRPSFGTLVRPRVSVLQIAVKGHVFLFDLPKLVKQTETEREETELVTFIQTLFSNPSITKLGYGMAGDLQSLASTYHLFANLNKEMQGIVDLLVVHKTLQKVHHNWSSGEAGVLSAGHGYCDEAVRQPEKGLSQLVQHVLGKPLDKTEQLSNWEKRPLRQAQIIYAANDAYCLLEVYNALLQRPEHFGLTSDLTDCLTEKQSKTTKAEKRKNKRDQPGPAQQILDYKSDRSALNASPAVSPREFSVICDNMLQGLGRYLRCVGVDVKMLDNEDDHRRAAEIAREEGRVILTCGMPYHTMCNCNKYLRIPKEKMMQLMGVKGCLSDTNGTDLPSERKGEQKLKAELENLDAATPECDQFENVTYNPNCQWAESSGLNMETLKFASGSPLQVGTVPLGVLEKVDLFYCCSSCGKVFWEGSHFGHVISQFKEVLNMTGTKTFYDV